MRFFVFALLVLLGSAKQFLGSGGFELIDTDNNGLLSIDEISAFIDKSENALPLSAEGLLLKDLPERTAAFAVHADADGDGIITEQELQPLRHTLHAIGKSAAKAPVSKAAALKTENASPLLLMKKGAKRAHAKKSEKVEQEVTHSAFARALVSKNENCQWYTTNDPCSATCGTGSYTTRCYISSPANGSGTCPCPNNGAFWGSYSCSASQPCAVDCKGHWVDDTTCSATCGDSTKRLKYVVDVAKVGSGAACEATQGQTKTVTCPTPKCPVNCVFTWQDQGACSVTCGNGQKTQTSVVSVQACNGGTACPAQTQTVPCMLPACPIIPCEGYYSFSGICSVSCGKGTGWESFVVTKPAINGGACPTGDKRLTVCADVPCPVDGVGHWEKTSGVCSTTCGQGYFTEVFVETVPAQFGGKPNEAAAGATRQVPCPVQPPCPVQCQGEWVSSGLCSATCGIGVQKQVYNVVIPAAYGGCGCEFAKGEQRDAPCVSGGCPVDCVGYWGEGGECDCATHKKTISYNVVVPAVNGGKECLTPDEKLTKDVDCQAPHCAAVDCQGQWVPLGKCCGQCNFMTTFGKGKQLEAYLIGTFAANDGQKCSAELGDTREDTCDLTCPICYETIPDACLNGTVEGYADFFTDEADAKKICNELGSLCLGYTQKKKGYKLGNAKEGPSKNGEVVSKKVPC